jgi:hypothetical protein
VLRNAPASGAACEICHFGFVPAVFGDTVTAGDNLMTDSSGRFVPHTGTNIIAGIAIEDGVVGETHTIFLTCGALQGYQSHYSVIPFPINLATIADGDLVTGYTPGFAGTIVKFDAITVIPASTAAKAATLNLEIGSTKVTGGVISLTTVACNALGKLVAGTAVASGNVFTNTDTISIEASSTTTFIEGSIVMLITLKT